MIFDADNLPPGLQAPKPPVDHIAAAKRAEALVQEIRSAGERGALNRARVNRALATINHDLMSVGQQYNAVAGNSRLFVLREHRHGKAVVGPHGTLKQVTEFSRLERSYKTLAEAMSEIEIIAEGLTQ